MGFVLKAPHHVGRTHIFGLPMKSSADIRQNIIGVLQHASRKKRKLARPTTEEFPLKRLRSNLAHAMACDVIFQPVAGVFKKKNKSEPAKFTNNPIWDMAPNGAYYKAKKLCSLLQPVVTHGCMSIVSDLTRLAINIWRMPRKAFDGLLRKIRSKIVSFSKRTPPVWGFSKRKDKFPDAVQTLSSLSTNPILMNSVYWFTRNQKKKGETRSIRALLGSTSVERVRFGLYLRYKRGIRADS